MLKKRGVVEIQFNWILVMVAGALIFLFFFSVIRWAVRSSSESSAATVSAYLDSILTGASVPRDTTNILKFPFKNIEFTCDSYRVEKSSNTKSIRNKIIFAPTRLENGEIITWSLGWDVPFRVTNFLFLSSSKIRYVFIGSGRPDDPSNKVLYYLYTNFPEELNPEFYPPLDRVNIRDLNNFKVRLVYVNTPIRDSDISAFEDMPAEDVTALVIQETGLDDSIEISFYNKKRNDVIDSGKWDALSEKSSIAFGKASLMAAIFSDTPEDYSCNMEKALKRLNYIASIYGERSDDLAVFYAGTNCQSPHQTAGAQLGVMSSLDIGNIRSLSGLVAGLRQANREAQQNSCALIY